MVNSISTVLARQRKGDWMQTFTGIQFWPLDPDANEIEIEDISHALSNLCRYNGHCNGFYSVAQHSVLVSEIIPSTYAMEGLLHDAAEAYIGDVIRPLKRYLPAFKRAEKFLEFAIRAKFGLIDRSIPLIKQADNIALATEKRDVMGKAPVKWDLGGAKPRKEIIVPWDPRTADEKFIDRFEELGGDI